jgi:hypothetical protein
MRCPASTVAPSTRSDELLRRVRVQDQIFIIRVEFNLQGRMECPENQNARHASRLSPACGWFDRPCGARADCPDGPMLQILKRKGK